MRILMISDVYFPRVNGVSTSIQTFRADLEALGVPSDLIAPEYPGGGNEEAVLRVPSRYLFFDPEDRFMKRRAILAMARSFRGRYDLVHIHTPFVAHSAGLRLAQKLGVPTVESYHTFFEEYFHLYLPVLPKPMLRSIAARVSRRQCNAVDSVVVPTAVIRDVLQDYGVTRPINVIPTGLNLASLEGGDGARFRAEFHIPADRPVMLTVGRVAMEKNIDFLIDVLARVRRDLPSVLFIIAGEGPALKAHRQRVEREGLTDNVLFVGYLDRRRGLLDCYAAANVFVFASRTETQGLVLLESMALGTPVISTAVLGTREVLDGARGVIAVRENLTEFSAAVTGLLRDPGRQAAMGAEARGCAAQWSSRAMAERLTQLYAGLGDEPG
jgi:1,2-diacylglycerol 3-alpha-glucosyltransferase